MEEPRQQVEALVLDKKQRIKFLIDNWRRWKEIEKEMREAEKRERLRKAEAEERERICRTKAEKRKVEMEIEKLKIEVEAKRIEAETRLERQEDRRHMAAGARAPKLPSFAYGKNNLNSYLSRFESIIAYQFRRMRYFHHWRYHTGTTNPQ